ncbi:MAG: phage replisome organizer N-terminal domain-containing protein [Phycisphaerae bacterium]|nr:phage replisome organizer N-terminal domain-containing protein [Phycisphaerae bacterium]
MTSMPWIKLYTDILDDPKIGTMNAADKWRFVALCALAGECDAEGYLANGDEPLTLTQIAWRLRENETELADSMTAHEARGLLINDDGVFLIVNFSNRQGRSQSEKREAWRERKRRQRGKSQDGGEDDTGSPDDDAENVPSDTTGTHAGVTPLEKSIAEKKESRGETESAGADVPATPTTFQEWSDVIRTSENRPAALVTMYEALYPGRDPPAYGYAGKVAREAGGAGRLAELLWQHSTRPPTGDVLAYVLGQIKREKGDRHETRTQHSRGNGSGDGRRPAEQPVSPADPDTIARQRKSLEEHAERRARERDAGP